MRVYDASYACTSVTAAQSLMMITAASSTVVRIRKIVAGDADVDTNEQTYLEIARVTSVGSAAGTSVTPSKRSKGDAVCSATVIADLGTEPTTLGAVSALEAVPMVAGYRWEARDETEYFEISPSESVVIKLMGAVSSSTWPITVTFDELGG